MRPQSPSIPPFERTGVSFGLQHRTRPALPTSVRSWRKLPAKMLPAIDPALHVIEVQCHRRTAPELLLFLKKGSLMPQKVTMIALASALTGFAFTPVIAAEREQVRSRSCKRRPSFEGQFLLSGSPHGRHQSAVSPRAPGLDRQAGGCRATGGYCERRPRVRCLRASRPGDGF